MFAYSVANTSLTSGISYTANLMPSSKSFYRARGENFGSIPCNYIAERVDLCHVTESVVKGAFKIVTM